MTNKIMRMLVIATERIETTFVVPFPKIITVKTFEKLNYTTVYHYQDSDLTALSPFFVMSLIQREESPDPRTDSHAT